MGQRRWLVVSDNHGDAQDDKAVEAMFGFLKYWKPEIRIHAGDCFDFRPLRKKASDQEMREGTSDDVRMGIEFISRYRPTHFLRGNHDERLWDLHLSDDGQKRERALDTADAIMSALTKNGCSEVFPYNKRTGVCQIGHLRVVHGYSCGINAAKKHAEVYGACLFGHVHRIEQYSIPSLERHIGRCVGCLCKLDQDYNRAQLNTLSQEHGFAYGFIDDSGTYTYYQAMPLNGKWLFPSEWHSA